MPCHGYACVAWHSQLVRVMCDVRTVAAPAYRAPAGGYAPVSNSGDNPPCNTLFVGNLSDHVDENELRALFANMGVRGGWRCGAGVQAGQASWMDQRTHHVGTRRRGMAHAACQVQHAACALACHASAACMHACMRASTVNECA